MADEDTHVRVQASKLPDDVIEQPLGTLCADDIVCPVTARTRRPSPMQLFLTQLKRVHLDPQLTNNAIVPMKLLIRPIARWEEGPCTLIR